MVYFFASAIMLFFYIDFKIIVMILKRNAKYFEENKKYGKAEVVGYDSSEGSRWYSLIVRVLNLNESKTYICNSAKINIHDYPKGKIVDVIYAVTKRGHVNVYLRDRMPADEGHMSKIFNVVSKIILAITIILLMIGIATVCL